MLRARVALIEWKLTSPWCVVAVLGLSVWLLAVYVQNIYHDSLVWPFAYAVAAICLMLRLTVEPMQQTVSETPVEATKPSISNSIFF